MLRILWMLRNIWCIILATFKMIAMSSARSASILSVVKPKPTTAIAVVLILPLANLDPMSYPAPCKPRPLNPPLILLLSKEHQCLHIKHQVFITLRVESPDIQMRQKCGGHVCKRLTSRKWLCLRHNVRRNLLCLLHYVTVKPKCYKLLPYRQNVLRLCTKKFVTLSTGISTL